MKEFATPALSSDGVRVLTRAKEGDFQETMMDITAYELQAGKSRSFCSDTQETAVLLVEGAVAFSWNGREEEASRNSCIADGAYCLHVCRGVRVTVTARAQSEILVQQTENDRSFEAHYYTPENCRNETFGADQYGGKAIRTVRTFFDYDSAPYSNMVCGEILTPHGGWSSYIPHHHPQPEVYYYRFDKPQGFGACFIGDNAYVVHDHSFCAIPGGKVHPQVTAPGYTMYYVWMIRHFDGAPWRDRIYAPEHEWLLDAKL